MVRISALIPALALLAFAAPLRAQEATGTAPNVVDVMAVDYAFGIPAEIPAGWTTFRMKNMGREVHIMSLALLPASVDLAEIRALNRAYVRDQHQVPAPATFLGGVGHLGAGDSGYFTATYRPGRYLLLCQQHPEEQLVVEVPGS